VGALARVQAESGARMTRSWSFITNHAFVMVYVVCHPESTVREIASGVGLTERATLAILRELDEQGIIERERDGRKNIYSVNFPALAAYRREGAATRTPPEFVDALVRTLATLNEGHPHGMARALPDTAMLETIHGSWGFFTNHLLTLLEIAVGQSSTVREMALRADMTERAVLTIIKQLEDEGIIIKNREGRRNSYVIDYDKFGSFGRWSPGTWQLPPELVDIAVKGLKFLAQRSYAAAAAEPAKPARGVAMRPLPSGV
jgi:DNA-binding MarR family transcriptional regulator